MKYPQQIMCEDLFERSRELYFHQLLQTTHFLVKHLRYVLYWHYLKVIPGLIHLNISKIIHCHFNSLKM